MKVLVLGGAGFLGQVIVKRLLEQEGCSPIIASRGPGPSQGAEAISLNALDREHLARVVSDVDCVVNCVTGSKQTIIETSVSLVDVLQNSKHKPKCVHMSTMSVYGGQEGLVAESAATQADIGWYGEAKIAAERAFSSYVSQGGTVYILRPGCIYGPGSQLWTDRIGKLLSSARLGDLAEAGDGWSNLVHVDDVAAATLSCIRDSENSGEFIFNLAAPDSPRWNRYFQDFALALDATPLQFLHSRTLAVETKIIAPPIKVLERISGKFRMRSDWLPESIPPSLCRLWGQHIKLDSRSIEDVFGFRWVPYSRGVEESAEYFKNRFGS
ncbi:NAD(P)-dependent oxidoreductase [Ketobacter sp. MCCC 1A13808]|uniref:NAD-dependent epimerase/dehydratase family protein n=1 Tax=Ketobacter sp. MCCC 1A13808 TaxID=2602738 RepID=UPI0012EB2322|nr:NAD(P)-dependent oxidoreductase [Ketobacter sp. MCCC 1A13808]MVF11151.1 NAD(P)-dependent oxidoreductase [Ketobacter sp. MCCC 1A13808]